MTTEQFKILATKMWNDMMDLPTNEKAIAYLQDVITEIYKTGRANDEM